MELNLRELEITNIDTGMLRLSKKPLDRIYVTFEVNGFEKHVTFKDSSFRTIIDAMRREILNMDFGKVKEVTI